VNTDPQLPAPGPASMTALKTKLLTSIATVAVLALAAAPAGLAAANDLNGVIDNLRVWLAGLLAALATLFLTIGGIRYLLAGGDPAALERAKGSVRAAIIGYALALLAPVLATIVQHVVGG
jgi:hypothetical protein